MAGRHHRYTDVRTRKYSQWEDFSGDRHTKTNHSILNFACGKKVTGTASGVW